jgi:hypothetical protein
MKPCAQNSFSSALGHANAGPEDLLCTQML